MKKSIALFSGGKDSFYAVQRTLKEETLDLLVSVCSPNGNTQLHAGPETTKSIREAQLNAIGLPFRQLEISYDKDYLHELFIALKRIVDGESTRYLITGDLWHPYTGGIGDMLAGALGVKLIRPAREKCPSKDYAVEYMRSVLNEGIEGVVVSIREGLPKELVGRRIDNEFINELSAKGLDVAGESGEYQSLVVSAPIMKNKVVVDDYDINLTYGKNGKERFHRMNIKNFHLENA